MTAAASSAFTYSLIPAQVPGAKHSVKKKCDGSSGAAAAVAVSDSEEHSSTAGDEVVYSPSPKHSKKSQYQYQQRTGNLPDVHWRSIPMTHLRSHPNFQPLPPPSLIHTLPTKEHVRYFRQDSWQWDYLHIGRCTTSQTAAALGFLERKAAQYLGIPSSLRRGGYGAWERLRQPVPLEYENLIELERVLCDGGGGRIVKNATSSSATKTHSSNDNNKAIYTSWRPGTKETERLWITSQELFRQQQGRNNHNNSNTIISSPSPKPFPFVAKYIPNMTKQDLCQRKQALLSNHQKTSPISPIATRMRWGNAQEATSILTALNYFCRLDDKTIIREVGMCGAGFDRRNHHHDDCNDDDSSSRSKSSDLLKGLRIGATPDAIICHGDGTVEVLEVKNHCPFVWNKISPQYASSSSSYGGRGSNRNNKQKKTKNKKLLNGHRRRHANSRKLNDDIADDYGDDGDQQPSEQKTKNESTNNRLPKHFLLRDFHLERKIPPVYIPQLMLEILCIGDAIDLDENDHEQQQQSEPICKSAIMVRQTATKGAIILRLNRDEEWITEMKYWLGKFKSDYVDTGLIPEDDFFWNSGGERYQKFLERTKELSEDVEFVALIEHGKIQRVVFENGLKGEIPLFLDNVEKEN